MEHSTMPHNAPHTPPASNVAPEARDRLVLTVAELAQAMGISTPAEYVGKRADPGPPTWSDEPASEAEADRRASLCERYHTVQQARERWEADVYDAWDDVAERAVAEIGLDVKIDHVAGTATLEPLPGHDWHAVAGHVFEIAQGFGMTSRTTFDEWAADAHANGRSKIRDRWRRVVRNTIEALALWPDVYGARSWEREFQCEIGDR
jgi:hypothetical protein